MEIYFLGWRSMSFVNYIGQVEKGANKREPVVHNVKRLFVMGGSYIRHVGDDVILETNIAAIRKECPHADILLISANPERTRERIQPGIEHILCKNVREDKTWQLHFWLRFLKLYLVVKCRTVFNLQFLLDPEETRFIESLIWSDVVITAGGGNLTSHWRYTQLYAKCCTYILASLLGKKVILSGQGIGPIDTWMDRFVVKTGLNRAAVIGVREEQSYEELQKLRLNGPVIELSFDDAVTANAAPVEEVMSHLKEYSLKQGRPYIVVSLHRWSGLDRFLAEMPSVLNHLIETLDCDILFIPMCFTPPDDDRIILTTIKEKVKYPLRTHLLDEKFNDNMLVGIIANSYMTIGSRFHLAVFSLANRVPSIGLYSARYYEIKMRGLFKQFGQEEFICSLSDNIVEKTDQLLRVYQECKEKLTGLSRSLRNVELPVVRYLKYDTMVGDASLPDYSAIFTGWDVPSILRKNRKYVISAQIKNTGKKEWKAVPSEGSSIVSVGYHLLDEAGKVILWDNPRPIVPYTVYPGDEFTIRMPIEIQSIPAHTVKFCWDICLEQEYWFSQLAENNFPQINIKIED